MRPRQPAGSVEQTDRPASCTGGAPPGGGRLSVRRQSPPYPVAGGWRPSAPGRGRRGPREGERRCADLDLPRAYVGPDGVAGAATTRREERHQGLLLGSPGLGLPPVVGCEGRGRDLPRRDAGRHPAQRVPPGLRERREVHSGFPQRLLEELADVARIGSAAPAREVAEGGGCRVRPPAPRQRPSADPRAATRPHGSGTRPHTERRYRARAGRETSPRQPASRGPRSTAPRWTPARAAPARPPARCPRAVGVAEFGAEAVSKVRIRGHHADGRCGACPTRRYGVGVPRVHRRLDDHELTGGVRSAARDAPRPATAPVAPRKFPRRRGEPLGWVALNRDLGLPEDHLIGHRAADRESPGRP